MTLPCIDSHIQEIDCNLRKSKRVANLRQMIRLMPKEEEQRKEPAPLIRMQGCRHKSSSTQGQVGIQLGKVPNREHQIGHRGRGLLWIRSLHQLKLALPFLTQDGISGKIFWAPIVSSMFLFLVSILVTWTKALALAWPLPAPLGQGFTNT